MTTTDAPFDPPRPLWRDALPIGLLLLALLGAALAAAWPWLPTADPGGDLLARYLPQRDGAAWLNVVRQRDGAIRQWRSSSERVIPGARAIARDLRRAHLDAIEAFYRQPDEGALAQEELAQRLARTQIVQTSQRTVDAAGAMTDTVIYSLREPRGLYTVGYYLPASETDILFDPPLLDLPAVAAPGDTWQSEGLVGVVPYRYAARLAAIEPHQSALGRWDDCLRVEGRLILTPPGGSASETLSTAWICPEVGAVTFEEHDAAGTLTRRTLLASVPGQPVEADLLPPPTDVAPPEPVAPDSFGGWTYTRVGRSRPDVEAPESTIPPVWVPGEPPLLLAAGSGGDLVAFDASSPAGRELWRFHTAGTLFSPPAWDAARGRLFFGASDKHLYALDRRGLFLWSFRTGDSIASRPLVVGDTVVFGSEDRRIYGLDADTGALRWSLATGGPVVSSPALVGGIAVIGSDDGAAYGVDVAACNRAPDACEPRWLFPTEDAVEAPIVAAEGVAWVASRDGTLYALDGATGELRWAAEAGDRLRTAPAVDDQRVYVVHDYGRLVAFERESGRRLWRSAEETYIGPPLLVGDSLLVAGSDGLVHRLSRDGERLEQWPVAEGGAEASTDFYLGLAAGGDALWLADDNAYVWRLGPASGPVAAAPLAPLWLKSVADPPFQLRSLYAAPAEAEGQALVVDGAYTLYLLDPATGEGRAVGQVAAETGVPFVEPVVAGDVALVSLGTALHAVSLADGSAQWSVEGGFALHPPTVAGETVLLLARLGEMGQAGPARLQALDLATGALRWQADLGEVEFPGNVLVGGDTVFVSTPPAAFDLAMGEPRWQAEGIGTSAGGALLHAAGARLFVGLVNPDGNSGAVAALDAATGEERWRAPLPADFLDPFDRLWQSDDVLIVPSATGTGTVIALDAATGEERWRYEPDAALFGNVSVQAGRVWLVRVDGQVLALDAQRGEVVARFDGAGMSLEGLDAYSQRPVLFDDALIAPIGLGFLGFAMPE